MFLFPSDIDSLSTLLAERLDLDPELVTACTPLLEQESYQDLIEASFNTLIQRLARKTGLKPDELPEKDWQQLVDWEAAGICTETVQSLTGLVVCLLDQFALPAGAKSSRALVLLVDVLLDELDRLPDLVQAEDELNNFDGRPFFSELVKSLNALLPYEQRDFPTEFEPTQAQLFLTGLPENAFYAVTITPPVGEEPGQVGMGLILMGDDRAELTRHFRRKLPGLIHSMGGKEIVLEEIDETTQINLYQPFQPTEKLSAFMTAATLVGLIGSLNERMPRRGAS